MARDKKADNDERRLPIRVYDQMFDAYLINEDPKHIAEVTGVSLATVVKYIEKGDPRRRLPALSTRLKDAKAANRHLNKDRIRNILEKRALQKSAFSDMMYTTMVDRDTHTLINPAHATPKDYIAMTKDELEAHMALQGWMDKEAEEVEYGGEKVKFEDPATRARLKRMLVAAKQEAIIATLRTVVELLDPSGSRGIRNELPPPLRRALDSDDVEDVTDLAEPVTSE